MLAAYLIFSVIFVLPVFILFSIVAVIRKFTRKFPSFVSFDKEFLPYDYYKENGDIAIGLTLVFGSFGILYANIGLAYLIFFFNTIPYFIIFVSTWFAPDAPVIVLAIIPVTRAIDVLAIFLFARKRLKLAEEDFSIYIDIVLYGAVNYPYREVDKALPKVDREKVKRNRYEKEKEVLYGKWKSVDI